MTEYFQLKRVQNSEMVTFVPATFAYILGPTPFLLSDQSDALIQL